MLKELIDLNKKKNKSALKKYNFDELPILINFIIKTNEIKKQKHSSLKQIKDYCEKHI